MWQKIGATGRLGIIFNKHLTQVRKKLDCFTVENRVFLLIKESSFFEHVRGNCKIGSQMTYHQDQTMVHLSLKPEKKSNYFDRVLKLDEANKEECHRYYVRFLVYLI